MIVLTVISLNGTAVSIAPTSFDEIGGTIGRADSNQLVLPDVERTVSRVHAQVAFRSGQYALIDRGSNPVLHNGRPIGNGREELLVSGDEIQIGGYLIKVSCSLLAKSDDPFADFDGEGSGLGASIQAISKVQAPVPVAKAPASSLAAKPAPRSNHRPADGIPDDWDPFRPDPPISNSIDSTFGGDQSPVARTQGLNRSDQASIQSLPISTPGDSLDDLFGLKSGATSGDPLAGSSLQAQLGQPNTAAGADPMRALLQPAAPSSGSVHDHDSDMKTPWRDMPVMAKAKPVPPAPPALSGAVLSWERAEKQSVPMSRPSGANSSAENVPPAAHVADTGQKRLDNQDLLQAFLNGLGMPSLVLQPLNAETMFQLGQLLRESTKGTVELLAARTALKKEVRAAVTVMVSTSNNALKFSPTVEFALQYLLGPPTAGFMGPLDSMRDAYDDLKAHQLGVMAGMRAALSDVLKRFDPAVLEEKLVNRGNAFSLMPSGKKARLWELFQELFDQLAHEAEEDFDELFGKAFVREYERYVAQLNAGKTP